MFWANNSTWTKWTVEQTNSSCSFSQRKLVLKKVEPLRAKAKRVSVFVVLCRRKRPNPANWFSDWTFHYKPSVWSNFLVDAFCPGRERLYPWTNYKWLCFMCSANIFSLFSVDQADVKRWKIINDSVLLPFISTFIHILFLFPTFTAKSSHRRGTPVHKTVLASSVFILFSLFSSVIMFIEAAEPSYIPHLHGSSSGTTLALLSMYYAWKLRPLSGPKLLCY